MVDCLIVGGGVIGLSLAWELSKRGRSVRVLERDEPGREASWAGAGMLPPAKRDRAVHPLDHLHALSHELHPQWAVALLEETGIDNGYRLTGAIYLARRVGEAAALNAAAEHWREQAIVVERLSVDQLANLEPALAPVCRVAYLLPEEAQVRNPRHMKALLAACQGRGVDVRSNCGAREFEISGGRIVGVQAADGRHVGRQVCLCSGSWTGLLLEQLGISHGIAPVRGQIVLYRTGHAALRRIVNEGIRYLVPRDDGRVLVGSTQEEVGFNKHTTDEAISALRQFAEELMPSLAEAEVERAWAGLRPGTFDGMPYLGRIPGLENAFVAAGHFRNGLQLAPATAVEMARFMCGEPNAVDLSPFHVGRRRDFD